MVCTSCDAGKYSPTVAGTSMDVCRSCPVYPLALIQEGSVAGSASCWPGVLYANASNPPPIVVGFSVGDIVTIVFTSPTNAAAFPVEFFPNIGEVSFSWQSADSQLVVRVVDAGGTSPIDPSLVDIGILTFSLRGVQSAGGTSAAIPSSIVRPVGGTWGVPSPPRMDRVVALNTGGAAGFNTGDSLVVVFDQRVAQLAADTFAAVRVFLMFTPSLDGLVDAVGTWTSATTLTVVFTRVDGS